MTNELEEGEIESSDGESDERSAVPSSSLDTVNDENEIDKIIQETSKQKEDMEAEQLRKALLEQMKIKKCSNTSESHKRKRQRSVSGGSHRRENKKSVVEKNKKPTESRRKILSPQKISDLVSQFSQLKDKQGVHIPVKPIEPNNLLLPPPPPPPILPILTIPPTDNYETVDMDIEVGDSGKSDDEKDKESISDPNVTRVRHSSKQSNEDITENNSPSKATTSSSPVSQVLAVGKVRSLASRIRSQTHVLEKSISEMKRLKAQMARAKSKMAECQTEIIKSMKEKQKWESVVQNIRLDKVKEQCNRNNFDEKKINRFLKNGEDILKMIRDDEKLEAIPMVSDSEEEEEEEDGKEKENNKEEEEEEGGSSESIFNISCDQSEEMLRKKLLETMSKRANSVEKMTENSCDNSTTSSEEGKTDEQQNIIKGKQLLLKICKFDMNGICERGIACNFLHLKNGHFDEKLMLETILRFIYAYKEEDIEKAVLQMLTIRPNYASFAQFVKSFMSSTLKTDAAIQSRFYQFFQQG